MWNSITLWSLMYLVDLASNLEILDIRNQYSNQFKIDVTYASAPGVRDGSIRIIYCSN